MIKIKEKNFLKNINYKDELDKLKDIEKNITIEGCELTPSIFDFRGNNKDGEWAGECEKWGGEDYILPNGWIDMV